MVYNYFWKTYCTKFLHCIYERTFSMDHKESRSFIEQIIESDLASGKHGGEVKTRFPPEPNGYLHIGHAKAICVDFGYAIKYNGTCNLRFDDTNPVKEDTEYVESIKEDIKWLGFEWDNLFFASDYFDKMYDFACQLIKKDKAFVCDLSFEESKNYKGDYKVPGKPSPYRDRTIEENLDLFERMKNGEFGDGEKTLRAKIDYNHPNMIMRDPVIYRIQHKEHHNTGNKWCIYPMYDFAHPIEDAIEEITHSICTLEFESNREIYDWYLEQLKDNFRRLPHQYEFARLNITNTMMSKRYLRELVESGKVDGWDDPRMPTLSGLRRRGVRPEAIKNFVNSAGVSKANSEIDKANFDHFIRDDLFASPAIMTVLDPIKVTITNYPENKTEIVSGPLNSKNKDLGERDIVFGKEIFIEREDFSENPPKGYKRLVPGEEVRLRHAYFIKCEKVIKDKDGKVVELKCSYDIETKSGSGFKGRKPRGTIHWVHASENKKIRVNNYSDLMKDDGNGALVFNEDSLKVYEHAVAENYIETKAESRYQFIRHGFFAYDHNKSSDKPIFNLIVSLKG